MEARAPPAHLVQAPTGGKIDAGGLAQQGEGVGGQPLITGKVELGAVAGSQQHGAANAGLLAQVFQHLLLPGFGKAELLPDVDAGQRVIDAGHCDIQIVPLLSQRAMLTKKLWTKMHQSRPPDRAAKTPIPRVRAKNGAATGKGRSSGLASRRAPAFPAGAGGIVGACSAYTATGLRGICTRLPFSSQGMPLPFANLCRHKLLPGL